MLPFAQTFGANDAQSWAQRTRLFHGLGDGKLGATQICAPLLLVCLDDLSFRLLQRPLLSASPTSILDHSYMILKIHTVILLPPRHRTPTSAPSLTLTLGTGSRLCPGLKFGRSNSNSAYSSVASMASALLLIHSSGHTMAQKANPLGQGPLPVSSPPIV